VAILVKETLPLKISHIKTSGKGQYIILDAVINEKKFKFVNIYFPHTNKERISLIDELRPILPTDATIIMAGDFNFVENPKLDKQGGKPAQAVSTRKIFSQLTQEIDVVDLFRHKHPEEKEITSFKLQTRIDRIYVDKTMGGLTTQVSHVINTFADHRAVTATFKIPISIGLGYWKCNTSILEDNDLKQDLEAFWHKQVKRTKEDKIDLEWWENCKEKIKDIIIWHSKRSAQNRRDRLNHIDSKIQKLKEFYNSKDGEDNMIISQLIAEKQAALNYLCEGARIRAKANDLHNSEKPVAAFLQMGKNRGERRMIKNLIKADGSQAKDIHSLLDTAKNFYANLYSKKK
jgi:hypothetical protein